MGCCVDVVIWYVISIMLVNVCEGLMIYCGFVFVYYEEINSLYGFDDFVEVIVVGEVEVVKEIVGIEIVW